MIELKTLYRRTTHYLTGSVAVLLLSFVSFPIFTRLLSVEDYGLMSLVIKIAAMFTVFSKLGLQNAILRFHEESCSNLDPEAKQRYFSTFFFGSALAAIGAAVCCIVGVWITPHSLITASVKSLLLYGGVLIFIRTMLSIVLALFQAEGRTHVYNILQIGTRLGSLLIIVAVLLRWKNGAGGFLAGTVFVETICVLVASYLFFQSGLLGTRNFDPHFFKAALLFGFPLICYELASVVLDSGDRILVQHYLGAKELGYYSAAYNISSYLQQTLMTPINLALVPVYMKLWLNKGKEETQEFLSKSLDHFLLFATWIVCVVFLTAHDAIEFLASRKFQQADHLLPILVAGLMLYAVHIFLNAGLLIHKKTLTMAGIVALACIANLLLNVILLPRIGIMGAAWATLLSFAFLIALITVFSRQLLLIRFEWIGTLRYAAVAFFTWYVCNHVGFSEPLANLMTKSLLSIVLYAATLWLVDRKFRVFTVELIDSLRRSAGSEISGVPSSVKD